MELEKAIEILNLYEHAASSMPREDFLDAIKLSIEALKRIHRQRKNAMVFVHQPPLPGEDIT